MCDLFFKHEMEIEFDKNKDDINIRKHHYSLECAVDIMSSLLLLQGSKIIFSDGYIHMARIVCLSGGGCALHRYLGGDGQERTFIMIRRGG